MKFDTIISHVGNPPYQEEDGGYAASAKPVYHHFVMDAIKNSNAKRVMMIIPARWYAGGKGLEQFRKFMLNLKGLKTIIDYENSKDCFPQSDVNIEGGICIFLWERNYDGLCTMINKVGRTEVSKEQRDLSQYDILVRSNAGAKILDKVKAKGERSVSSIVSARKPFGLDTTFKDLGEQINQDDVLIYARGKQGYAPRSLVTDNGNLIDSYKVMLSQAYGGADAMNHPIIGKPFIAGPGSGCTDTYITVGLYKKEATVENLRTYMMTKFFRYMVSLRKISQANTRHVFKFAPLVDLTITWTDEMLYKRYELTDDEIALIEAKVREMSDA